MAARRFAGPQRVIVTCGGRHRRQFRRHLMLLGLGWQEDRSLLQSVFAVDVPAGQVFVLYGSEVS